MINKGHFSYILFTRSILGDKQILSLFSEDFFLLPGSSVAAEPVRFISIFLEKVILGITIEGASEPHLEVEGLMSHVPSLYCNLHEAFS